MSKVIVVGGGASGLFAALGAASVGNSVILLEKNEKLGKKIYITGKGRCNLTNAVDIEEFIRNVTSNPRFLYGALNLLSPLDTMKLFENLGLKLKVERGNRVFPESDKASDVTKTLEKALKSYNVDIRLNCEVTNLILTNNKIDGVCIGNEKIYADSVIICTGGSSYPSTGSTGDGYIFAKSTNHEVTRLSPSLVGFNLNGNDFTNMQGLALKNIAISLENNSKIIYKDFGEALFTHFGISGPVILSASSILSKQHLVKCVLHIDLKPALSIDILEQRLIREFSLSPKKTIFSVMQSLLPKSMIEIVLNRAGIKNDLITSNVTKEQRRNLISILKDFIFSVNSLRPVEEAIVTSGGVNVKNISSKTMESKIVSGLFFAGEVLDVDAFTGGFNLQIAFSTGYLAGINS